VDDSGLPLRDEDPTRAGVNIGTALGSAATNDEAYRRFYGTPPRRIRPFTIPRLMHNASASQVSMMFGLQGPTSCHSTACAASSHAIGEAGEIIRSGRADVMLAGGTDAAIVPGALTAWEALRLLAPAGDNPAAACRPFSRDRMGLVLAEGAGVLVLEEWDRARRRGAPIYAELAGYGATSDAGHITQPGVAAPARAIAAALAQAHLAPTAVGYINAHGTGTRLNDATETRVLVEAFGSHASALAISSTKSMHGHAMGASGAIELIATVLAISRGVLPPTAHYSEFDPECHLDYVPNTAREHQVAAALSNSFAFGGLNAALVVRRV
jgi:3-oxoacyl-(acyl-carrier-protein) synthase